MSRREARRTPAARPVRAGAGGRGSGDGGRRLGLPRSGRPRLPRLVTPGRAGGLLGMLATGYLLTLVTGSSAFALERTQLPELRWTDRAAVEAALGLAPGTNLVRVVTAPLEQRLRELPAVASAEVEVSLADGTLAVTIQEREPILGWQIDETVYLVDAEGVVVAVRPAEASAPDSPPAIQDRRSRSAAGLSIGDRLDPTDLDVATRLGSVRPADVGSTATSLQVLVTDRDGYLVRTAGWDAVFGFYGPATRSPELIAGQVRLLRSLLAERESTVKRVVLASDTDGTYVPRTTPGPTRR